MFSRQIAMLLFFIATLTVLAAATATTTVNVPAPTITAGAPANQCNTEGLNCCNSLERSDGSLVGNILGLLGIVLQGAVSLVGIQCTPIDILGLGQNSCAEMPLCCSDTTFSGLIAIGCVPININI